MKRILALILSAAIMCLFSGCSLFKPLKSTFRVHGGEESGVVYTEHSTSTGYTDEVDTSRSSVPHEDDDSGDSSDDSGNSQIAAQTGRYYYDKMNQVQREAYDDIYKAVLNMSNKHIPLKGVTNFNDVVLAYTGVRNDYPELFWLNGNFKWHVEDDVFSIQAGYSCTVKEKNAMKQVLDSAVNEFLNSVPSTANEYEKELAAFRWLTARATYDNKTAAAPEAASSDPNAFTAWGAIVKRTTPNGGGATASAVCEGYSRAFTLLLSKLGIRSTVVSGALDNEPHMWNIVNIGGEWYNVDTTVSDTDNAERYLLLNVTDAALTPQYSWDADFYSTNFDGSNIISAFNFKLPAAISNTYNHLSMAGRMIDLTDISAIDANVLAAYQRGENKCEFAFNDSTEYTYSGDTIVKMISYPECVSSVIALNPDLNFSISGIPGTRGFIITWN